MNEIEIFKNEEFGEVRVVEKDGEPWFVAKDVAEALGYSNPRDAVITHCKGVVKSDTLKDGGHYQNLINEHDVYRLVMRSKLPSAEKFQDWVMEEVLPSIRKNGGYLNPNVDFSDPDVMMKLLVSWKEDRQKLIKAEETISVLEPKADFYDVIIDSDGAVSMGDVAKLFGIPKFGRTKLFEYLRKKKILNQYNIPYSRFMDAQWFNVVETSYETPYGTNTNRTTRVYQKGIDHIRKLLEKDGLLNTL